VISDVERNDLLRRVDRRFVLRRRERPRTLVWASGRLGEAARLISEPTVPSRSSAFKISITSTGFFTRPPPDGVDANDATGYRATKTEPVGRFVAAGGEN
jgi:hypothetical protein